MTGHGVSRVGHGVWQGVTQPSAFAEPDVPDKLPVDDAHIVAWFDELEGYPSVGHCLPCPCPPLPPRAAAAAMPAAPLRYPPLSRPR